MNKIAAVFGGNDTLAWVGWALPHVIAPFGAAGFGTFTDTHGRKPAFLWPPASLRRAPSGSVVKLSKKNFFFKNFFFTQFQTE